MSRSILRPFAHYLDPTDSRHEDKDCAGNLKPQLVRNVAERTGGGAHRLGNRTQGAAAPGLLLRHLRADSKDDTQLAGC